MLLLTVCGSQKQHLLVRVGRGGNFGKQFMSPKGHIMGKKSRGVLCTRHGQKTLVAEVWALWNHIVDGPKVVSLGDSRVMTITSRRGTLGAFKHSIILGGGGLRLRLYHSILAQRARKIKKFQAKKLLISNKSISRKKFFEHFP